MDARSPICSNSVMNEIAEIKKDLRNRARQARRGAHARYARQAREALAGHGLGFAGLTASASVSGFSAIGEEIDPRLLLQRLSAEGHKLALPVIVGRDRPLFLAEWAPGDAMKEGLMQILEPIIAEGQEPLAVDCMLVPLLAVDRDGFRLGYGGGFYDRTIAMLKQIKPVMTIGLAFDAQIVEAVPREDHDEALDWILTPSGPLKCSHSWSDGPC